METKCVKPAKVENKDMFVLLMDEKGKLFNVSKNKQNKDELEVVVYENDISNKDVILINLNSDFGSYPNNQRHLQRVLDFLRENATWKKNGNYVSPYLSNVHSVTYELKSDVKYTINFFKCSSPDDIEKSMSTVELHVPNHESFSPSVAQTNFINCYFEIEKLVVKFDCDENRLVSYNGTYKTFTLLDSKLYSYEDDTTTFNCVSGYLSHASISVSEINDMLMLASNMYVNHSDITADYEADTGFLPFELNESLTSSDIEEGHRVAISNSMLDITGQGARIHADIILTNIDIELICPDPECVWVVRDLYFVLPHLIDEKYNYNIAASFDKKKVCRIFSTYINLCDSEYRGIEPHKVTVTIESLRCSMERDNEHFYFRAYALCGVGREKDVYPLDIFLRSNTNDAASKFNKKSVKEFFRNIKLIAELSGVDLSYF